MKLYWKVFLPIALAVLFSIGMTGWFMGSVLPDRLRARQTEVAEEFQNRVRGLGSPAPEDVFDLADSMGVRIHLIPAGRFRTGGPPEPPRVPGTLIIPGGPDFPYTIVAMVPLPGARASAAAGALLLLLAMVALVLHLVLKGVFRRLRNLETAAAVLGRGDTSIRYPASGERDEIEALGERFNAMAGRIDGLLKSHKELLGSVAHELRTPLARLTLALELLREQRVPREDMLERMEADITSLDRLVSELLEYNRLGRGVAPRLEPVDFSEVAEEVVASVSWGREGVDFGVSGEVEAVSDRGLLFRILENIVSNAARYADSRVLVEVGRRETAAFASVSDDGPGFPPAILSGGFAPFVKGGDSRGAGLGMSIALRASALIGGSLTAENPPEGGARVTLTVPEQGGRPTPPR
jgi:two-component system sensor histidine kinase RstB